MEGIPEGNLEEGAMETAPPSPLPTTDVDRRVSPRIQVGEGSGNASVGHLSPRGAQQPLMSVPIRLTPVHRPLTTHTPLGSPIHGARIRSNSLGSSVGPFLPGCAAAAYSPTAPVMSAYSARMSTLANPPPSPLLTSHGTNHDHDSAALQLPQMPPPEPTEVQRVMEAAATKERARAKSCEEEEANLGPDELRAVLKRERHRSARMAADLAALRASAVQSQFEAEVLEEGRINNLMRRLDVLQQEKGRIIVELEREEEMVRSRTSILWCQWAFS